MSWKPTFNLTHDKKPAGTVLSDGERSFVVPPTNKDGEELPSKLGKFFAKGGDFSTSFDQLYCLDIYNKKAKKSQKVVFRPAGTASNGSPQYVASPDEFGNFNKEPIFLYPSTPKGGSTSEGEDWG